MSAYDLLKIKILNCFIRLPKEQCTVTCLTKVLQEEKYKISRVMSSMEKDGLLDRSNTRKPMLTSLGIKTGQRIVERIDVITNHLIFEGVDESDALEDSLLIAMHCSDNTWEAFHATEEKYRLKKTIQETAHVTGKQVGKVLRSGVYKLPYIIYKMQTQDGNNISVANNGFEYPCKMVIREGKGEVVLRSKSMSRYSPTSQDIKSGSVLAVSYWFEDRYITIQLRGGIGTIPLEAFEFFKRGEGSEYVLYGSVKLKILFSIGDSQKQEREAILSFTI